MKTPRIIAIAAVLAAAVGLAAMAAAGGWTDHGAAAGARTTARLSFAWFITAWSASSVAKLWPGGWRTVLLRRRRAVGLGFAASHLVHAVFFASAILVFDMPTRPVLLIGGGLGYAFILAMAATSNDASVRALGPKGWKLLHSIGGWYIAFIFASSYLSRLFGDRPLVGAYGVGLLTLAIGLRMAAFAKGRARLQTA